MGYVGAGQSNKNSPKKTVKSDLPPRETKVKDKDHRLQVQCHETSREQKKKMMMKCGIPSCGCSDLPIPLRI
jgi:hypothetical protein